MKMRLPAEWDHQQLVLFSFPRSDGDWGKQLGAASQAMIEAANAVKKAAEVVMIVNDPAHFAFYAEAFKGEVLELPTNDCWIRDYGPITTQYGPEKVRVLNDFTFNGWGGKFEAALDNGTPQRLWRAIFPEDGYRKSDIVLEGGSIETDGGGLILTTTKCLLNVNRNGWTTKAEAEEALGEYFDIEKVLWLEHGHLAGDDTDAHIDTLARFAAPDSISYVKCDDPEDEHYAELQAMEAELKAFRNLNGKPFKLFPLPWPPAVYSQDDGRRLPATYANYLICNDVCFMPVYFRHEAPNHPGHAADAAAVEFFKDFATEVVPVDCRAFIEQGGSLHCLTMNIPI